MSRQNETIQFLPTLINRNPVVFKQMTLIEAVIAFMLGVVVGFVIGVVIVFVFQVSFSVSMVFALLGGLAGGNIGGFVISRLKRNKPDTWFDRYIEFKLSPSKFITRDQVWSIKRSVRSLK
ncbi:TIGR03750 family conjugal transfer protein [Mannheimia glucosida]|uniref:TIGR03750 family conjugal transfer protein n=1 Tax=Mannheimia glucosida TaxID=85401 RepID=UPI003917FBD0